MCWRLAAMALALGPAACRAEEAAVPRGVLTNHDVVTLADAGFSQDFLIEMIATSRPRFDTTADGLADLAKHGIKEDVIRAMRGARPTPAAAAATEPENASGGAPKPIRVFVESSPNSSFPALAHPLAAEIVEAFGRKCPDVIVTSRKEAATFTVVLETVHRTHRKMVAFDRAGDMIYGAAEGSLAKAVRGFCGVAPKFVTSKAEGRPQDGLPGARWPQ
jgi:hypothetical protein